VDPGKDVEIYAFPCVLAVPVGPDERNWRTVENGRYSEGDSKRKGNTNESIDFEAQFMPGKYAKAEEEERQLRENDCQGVEYLC
jgi:hypothetical protein